MKWETERWIKLYTRDTVTWRRWGWQGQCVFLQLLRRVDSTGGIDLDGLEPWEAVSIASDGMPEDICRAGVDALLSTGTCVVEAGELRLPNYAAAQESRTSDAERKRRQRAKRKREQESQDVTASGTSRTSVTPCDSRSQQVTDGHDKRDRERDREIERERDVDGGGARDPLTVDPSTLTRSEIEQALQAAGCAIVVPRQLDYAKERAVEVGGLGVLVAKLVELRDEARGRGEVWQAGRAVQSRNFAKAVAEPEHRAFLDVAPEFSTQRSPPPKYKTPEEMTPEELAAHEASEAQWAAFARGELGS